LAVGSWQLAVVISRGWGEKPGFYEILCLVTINLARNPVSEVIAILIYGEALLHKKHPKIL